MRTTTFTFLDYLPDSLREAPKRRAAEFVGLGVLAALVAACAALVTWSVADPSLNHATSTPIHNLLGRPGAIVADVAMQFFGLGLRRGADSAGPLGLAPDRPKSASTASATSSILWAGRLDAGGRMRLAAADPGELAAADRARRRRRRRRAVGSAPAARRLAARPGRSSAWRSPPARSCRSPPPPATTSSRRPTAEIGVGRRSRAATPTRALRERRRRQRRRAGLRPRLARRADPYRADDQERGCGGCCSRKAPAPAVGPAARAPWLGREPDAFVADLSAYAPPGERIEPTLTRAAAPDVEAPTRVAAPAAALKPGRRATQRSATVAARPRRLRTAAARRCSPSRRRRSPQKSPRTRWSRTRACWKACSTISASRARSSTCAPARSSRSTNSSPRRASSRRASSASPTTSRARCRRSRPASRWCRGATRSASNCPTSGARRSTCASCWRARISRSRSTASPSRSARRSAASR